MSGGRIARHTGQVQATPGASPGVSYDFFRSLDATPIKSIVPVGVAAKRKRLRCGVSTTHRLAPDKAAQEAHWFMVELLARSSKQDQDQW